MARTFNVSNNFYDPGTYGPFAVDALTKGDTSALRLTVVQGAPWPDERHVATISLTWDSGDGATYFVPGVWRKRDGTLTNTGIFTFTTPSANISSGTILFETFFRISCALSLEAIA